MASPLPQAMFSMNRTAPHGSVSGNLSPTSARRSPSFEAIAALVGPVSGSNLTLRKPTSKRPGRELCLCEIEDAVGFDQHIDRHQEAHSVTAPFVVEDKSMTASSPPAGKAS